MVRSSVQTFICFSVLLTIIMGCSSQLEHDVLHEAFLISMTLTPLDDSLNDYNVTVTKNYYDKEWYGTALKWSKDQNVDSFVGSAYYKKAEGKMEFTHTFVEKQDRDDFFASEEYTNLGLNLSKAFEIITSTKFDRVSGHDDPGPGP